LILFTGALIHVTSRADHCGFVLNPVTLWRRCGLCLCCGMRVSLLWNACFLACGMSRRVGKCPECLEECLRKSRCHTHTHVGHKALPPLCNLSRLLRRVAPPAAAATHTVSCADSWRWRRRPVQIVRLLPPAPPLNSLPRRANGPLGFLNVFRCRPRVRAVLGFQARSLGGVIACRPVRIPVASAVFFSLDGSPPAVVGEAVGDVTTRPRGGTRRRVCGIFRSHLGER